MDKLAKIVKYHPFSTHVSFSEKLNFCVRTKWMMPYTTVANFSCVEITVTSHRQSKKICICQQQHNISKKTLFALWSVNKLQT